MLEKIKKSFRSASSKNGSYSVGMIALVICMVIVVNLIAGQLPESVKSIDISDNNIYGVSKTSKKLLNKLDKKVTFKIYAEKDSTDTRIKSFIKKYTALSDKISVKWIDPVLHPAALTKAGVDKNTIVISCKDTGKTKSVSFDEASINNRSQSSGILPVIIRFTSSVVRLFLLNSFVTESENVASPCPVV